MNDHDLDTLFARAREDTPADAGAAERFLTRHRAEQSATGAPPPASIRFPRWLLLVACAALLGGLFVPHAAPALPASAAYDAYQAALGEGW